MKKFLKLYGIIDEEVFKKFELNLDEMRWEKISVMQQSTIDYWESLGYKTIKKGKIIL